jgi:hypothetical protein
VALSKVENVLKQCPLVVGLYKLNLVYPSIA